MKLHEPVLNFKPYAYPQGDVTQFFGESPELYSKTVCYADTHEAGGKYCLAGHNGWDIVRAYGTPIMAVSDGVVTEVNPENATTGYGRDVRIRNQTDEWVYGHLSVVSVTLGQVIKAGDVIGNMGNSGFVVSTANANGYWKYNPYAGTHLHLGRRPVNPGTNTVADYYNGYFGYVTIAASSFDIKPYQFVKDFGFMATGQDVRELQLRLGVSPTGFFWTLTRAAVKAFQSANGVPNTGYVGPLTRGVLNAVATV